MNTHRKTWGYGTPTLSTSHTVAWIQALTDWKPLRRGDRRKGEKTFCDISSCSGLGGGELFLFRPPLMSQDCPLRSFKALTVCHYVFPRTPYCSCLLECAIYCEIVQSQSLLFPSDIHNLHNANSNLLWMNMSTAVHTLTNTLPSGKYSLTYS